MNGIDRSPRERNGELKPPKKETRDSPHSEASSHGSERPSNGTMHKSIKEV